MEPPMTLSRPGRSEEPRRSAGKFRRPCSRAPTRLSNKLAFDSGFLLHLLTAAFGRVLIQIVAQDMGPVLSCALRRLASICLSDVMARRDFCELGLPIDPPLAASKMLMQYGARLRRGRDCWIGSPSM
jgi:hypothetical protein